jgi:hypothetical protein
VRPAGRRRRRKPARRLIGWVLVFALVFIVGIALGEALEDNPRQGRTITQDRTFTLRPQSATVTVTAP